MGYNFKSSVNLQVQSVKEVSSNRLQTEFDANGNIAVKNNGRVPLPVKDSRRVQTSVVVKSVSQNNQNSDFTTLDSSTRDVYLTGSHGLTSLYPSILLTSPMTSNVVDANSGLTTTELVIDLNNEIKKSIEKSVKDALNRYGSALSLTNSQFDQNVQIAKQYSNLCLQTALSKDKLISLLDISNTSLTQNVNQSQHISVGQDPYVYFQNKTDLISYLPTIDENYNTNIFQIGTNTQAITQILKTIYNYFVVGDLSFDSVNSDTSGTTALNGTIDGYIDPLYVNEINNLKKYFIPSSGSFSIKITQGSRSTIFSFENYHKAENITSLTRLIQRDLVIQGLKPDISENFFNTAQQRLGTYTGPYASAVRQNVFPIYGYNNVEEIISNTTDINLLKFRTAFVESENGSYFGRLDSQTGIDYLIYRDLAASMLPSFNNFTNTLNLYTDYANQIYYLILKTVPGSPSARHYRNAVSQYEIALKIKDAFLNFIKDSKINTDELAREDDAFRIGCFILAAKDDNFSAKLFRFMCAYDKKLQGLNTPQFSDEIKNSKNDVIDAINKKNGITTLGAAANLTQLGQVSDGNKGKFKITSDYMEEVSSYRHIFNMFHSVVRSTENAYVSNSDSEFDVNIAATTSFGLSTTRDARAFIIYNLFLCVLREMAIAVQVEDGDSPVKRTKMKVQYHPLQFDTLKFAIENTEKSPDQLETALNQYLADVANTAGIFSVPGAGASATPDADSVDKFKHDVRLFHSKYFNAIVQKINHQHQVCLDMSGLLVNHSSQLKSQLDTFRSQVSSITSQIASQNLQSYESMLNTIQTEQAFLKKYLVDRYSNLLLGASYLPSAIDHNVGQAVNTKTLTSTYPTLSDASPSPVTRKFIVVVGLPTGLLESLRYQNTSTTSEHLYSIDLYFSNLQSESSDTLPVIKTFTFTSRAFLNEGSLLNDGPDTKSSELTNYSQIHDTTKFKVIDDLGNYVDVTPDSLAQVLGSSLIVDNHIIDHYTKLYLKTTTGINVSEEVFDLVPQDRTYPDTAQLAQYTSVVDGISSSFSNTAEGLLNKERILRDLSRATQLSPLQHKISMMVSKTFEKIHAMPIDVTGIIESLQIERADIAFLGVVAKIRLEENQPPVIFSPSPTQRSFANARSGENAKLTAESLGLTAGRSLGVDNIGINNMIETSNKFGGRLGGFRR
jgi:hypothetical protein